MYLGGLIVITRINNSITVLEVVLSSDCLQSCSCVTPRPVSSFVSFVFMVLVSAVAVLPSGGTMFYYMVDTQLFLQPQLLPNRINAVLTTSRLQMEHTVTLVHRVLLRRSLLLRCPAITRYTPKCNFIYTRKESRAFSELILMKLTNMLNCIT
jgi:hypothetical protein